MTARGNEGKAIFRDDRDRIHFVELLAGWGERFRLRLHAYVLMENHYHFLLNTPEANLSRAMQWLNTSYTVWFNRRHQRAGHLLQGRFKAVMVEAETWALGLSRYLHLNPVRLHRMGLAKAEQRARRQGVGERSSPEVVQQRVQLLRDYRWSSYRAYAGYQKPPPWLEPEVVLAFGGGRAKERRRHYREDCEAELKDGEEEASPWESVIGGLALGSEGFVRELRELLEATSAKGHSQEIAQVLRARPQFGEIRGVVEKLKGESWAKFRDRRGDWGRELALYLGREIGGMSLAALRQAVEARNLMTVSVAISRFRGQLSRQKSLGKLVAQATRELQYASRNV